MQDSAPVPVSPVGNRMGSISDLDGEPLDGLHRKTLTAEFSLVHALTKEFDVRLEVSAVPSHSK
ncbi:hypothetical protein [Nocardioides sp.]|uniref:hypothetical protein n=1 Tax=Nocardioides sp. TaxID=35761 RepID=UPI0032671657